MSAKINSELDKVDWEIANDFLIELMRARNNDRGHFGKSAVPTLRSTIAGKPAQVSFLSDALKVYDPIAREYLKPETYSSKSITSTFKIDKLSKIRLVAKISL